MSDEPEGWEKVKFESPHETTEVDRLELQYASVKAIIAKLYETLRLKSDPSTLTELDKTLMRGIVDARNMREMLRVRLANKYLGKS